jgi:hypothetical protein
MVLPLSYVAANVVVLCLLAAVATWWQHDFVILLWLGVGCSAALSLYVLRGWQLSGIGTQGLIDLARAPGFLFWKILLMLKRNGSSEWVRTEREKR